MDNLDGVKKGDYVLVKCRVDGVFSHSGMLSVTTRDCDNGFDAYLDEIEDVCDPPEDNTWPKEGDRCFYICSDGQIQDIRYSAGWPNLMGWMDSMMAVGNVFRTYEEAEFAMERLKVIKILKEYEDKDPVWDGNTPHYYIRYELSNKRIITAPHMEFKAGGTIYFRSHKDAKAAVEIVGEERIKKYYLGVIE